MRYYSLYPEVAGGKGENTVIDWNYPPWVVTKLHYEFEGWLGDVLLESWPCWILTMAAKQQLEALQVKGVEFDDVEVTTSQVFEELYPDRELPEFCWLKVNGKAGQDDFGVGPNKRLVVSERVLKTLQQLGLSHADVSEFLA